ncbi:MAG TPA: cupin domain-containing protein [Candidatus Limnocylindrales bacterium]
MERSIAISADRVGSVGIYSSVVTTAPGGRTRIHHHGECETSIYIVSGRARYTWGPTGLEDAMDAAAGDFVYIPAGEIHVEENASESEPLVVVLTRNCPGSVVHYVDEG